jgi:hypothetical protein
MRAVKYMNLPINQRINIKGYDEADAKFFGITGRRARIFRMRYNFTDWPEQYANQLLTIRYTNQGYKNY